MSTDKKLKWAIAILIVVALILGYVSLHYGKTTREIRQEAEDYAKKSKEFRHKYDSVMNIYEQRGKEISNLKDTIARKDSLLMVIDTEIETINKKYEKLINNIRRLNDDEFASLFDEL